MYKGKKILCIIPARGGSKGLPKKNIKKLLGKPLIGYTIQHAKKSKYIDRIIVSTEDKKIAAISKKYGAGIPFIRPSRLATDNSSIFDVLVHAMNWMEEKEKYYFDIVVLLHVTSPLRDAKDIDRSIELLFKKGADNVFSVTQPYRNPYFNMVEIKNNCVKLVKKGNYINRQDAPRVYDINGSIYVWWKNLLRTEKKNILKKTRIYIMPKERSVDIDDYIDFKLAETLLKAKYKPKAGKWKGTPLQLHIAEGK